VHRLGIVAEADDRVVPQQLVVLGADHRSHRLQRRGLTFRPAALGNLDDAENLGPGVPRPGAQLS
jgi:hypothetical protein